MLLLPASRISDHHGMMVVWDDDDDGMMLPLDDGCVGFAIGWVCLE
jgi:hypothetical protein